MSIEFTKELDRLKLTPNDVNLTDIKGVPNCTLTTACFDLTRFNNKSRNLNEAISNMKVLLTVPCYLVIHTDSICIDLIKEIRNSYNLDHLTRYVVTNFEDLSNFPYLDKIKSNREKYWPTRDERTSSESHLLCCNKFNFVLQTIYTNPFNTTKFGWIDGTNLKNNFSAICENYKDGMLLDILHNSSDKFHIQILNVTDKKYKNIDNKREYYEKYRWVVCGGFFVTAPDAGIKILNRLKDVFTNTTSPLNYGFGHGEEMFYLEILDEFPDDLHLSYGDYGQILDNFIVPTANIEYVYYTIIQGLKNNGHMDTYKKACAMLKQSADEYYIQLEPEIYKNL